MACGRCCKMPTQRTSPSKGGVTLIELVVVLAILAILTLFATGLWQPAAPSAPGGEIAPMQLARRAAVREGSPKQVTLLVGERRVVVTVLPDGRLVGDVPDGVDVLTGTGEARRMGR